MVWSRRSRTAGSLLRSDSNTSRNASPELLTKSKNAWKVAGTRCLLSVVEERASRTILTSSCALSSSSARYSSSLPGKCWYSTGLLTPARSAISSMAAAWYPWATNTSCAAPSNCLRRAGRGSRVVVGPCDLACGDAVTILSGSVLSLHVVLRPVQSYGLAGSPHGLSGSRLHRGSERALVPPHRPHLLPAALHVADCFGLA